MHATRLVDHIKLGWAQSPLNSLSPRIVPSSRNRLSRFQAFWDHFPVFEGWVYFLSGCLSYVEKMKDECIFRDPSLSNTRALGWLEGMNASFPKPRDSREEIRKLSPSHHATSAPMGPTFTFSKLFRDFWHLLHPSGLGEEWLGRKSWIEWRARFFRGKWLVRVNFARKFRFERKWSRGLASKSRFQPS